MAKDKKNQVPQSTKPSGISTKGYRKPQTATKAQEAPVSVSDGGMSPKQKKTIITIVASVLLTVIIATAVLVGINIYNSNFDYLTYNLGWYIDFDGGYKGFPLSLDVAKPHTKNDDGTGVSDVEMAIHDLIYRDKYANASPVEIGTINTATVALGDRVYIRYRAYVVEDDGTQVEVNGYNNFSLSDDAVKSTNPIAVGEYAGFDFDGLSAALIGVNTADYRRFAKKTEGAVEAGDVVYMSCKRVPTSDEEKVEIGINVRINLADADILATWQSTLVGKSIGTKLDDFTLTVDGVEYEYTETTIDYATTCENGGDKPVLTVEAYVPTTSTIAALRNETVYLDVYIVGVQKFNTWHSDESQPYTIAHDWNDEYVSALEGKTIRMLEGEEVKFKSASLDSYEGSLTEKFESYTWDYLMEDYENYYKDQYYSAIWSHYFNTAKVKSYPKVKVDEIYDGYYKDVIYQYETSGGVITYTSGNTYTFDNLDDYAVAYLDMSGSSSDWEGYLYQIAERLVLERLIIYYILKEENAVPTSDELKALNQQVRDEFVREGVRKSLKQDNKEESDFTSEEYAAYVDDIRSRLFAYYDDDYFNERAYRERAYEVFLRLAEVTTLDDVPAKPQDK